MSISLRILRWVARRILPATALIAGLSLTTAAFAASNPGDPLFCQPQEGTTFLIVNGGSGIFTADADCYGNNTNNDTQLTITTTQGGTLTGTRSAFSIDYVYTPPTPGFTGTDTFTINVTTVFNSAGGTGSAGGSSRPGGPATLTITLNVIPASTTLSGLVSVPVTLPVPAGSVSGCTPPGNAGQGPTSSAVVGCVTGITTGIGGVAPSHGTLHASGNTLTYTATSAGTDTFTYQAVGTNTDGTNALNSGNVTVSVTNTVPIPTLTPWALVLLGLGLPLIGLALTRRRFGF